MDSPRRPNAPAAGPSCPAAAKGSASKFGADSTPRACSSLPPRHGRAGERSAHPGRARRRSAHRQPHPRPAAHDRSPARGSRPPARHLARRGSDAPAGRTSDISDSQRSHSGRPHGHARHSHARTRHRRPRRVAPGAPALRRRYFIVNGADTNGPPNAGPTRSRNVRPAQRRGSGADHRRNICRPDRSSPTRMRIP